MSEARARTGIIIALLVVAVGALGACSGGGSADPTTATSTTAVTTSTFAATTTAVAIVAGASPERLRELALTAESGDPRTVEMPAPLDDATHAWLTGDGRIAADFVTAAAPLGAEGRADCDQVAVALEAVGTPPAVQDAIAQVPDPPTRDVLAGVQTTTLRVLAACGTEAAGYEDVRAEWAWTWTVAHERLVQLGVVT